MLVRPKNDTPREIPLTRATRMQLQKLFDGDGAPNPHALVWHRADGSPKTDTDDNNDLLGALLRAGVDQADATTHCLRHAYVTPRARGNPVGSVRRSQRTWQPGGV